MFYILSYPEQIWRTEITQTVTLSVEHWQLEPKVLGSITGLYTFSLNCYNSYKAGLFACIGKIKISNECLTSKQLKESKSIY